METVVTFQNCNIHQKQEIVLKNIDFQLNKNEIVYLIGKTGSGKSSLLKTIFAELPLNNGKGFVVGFNLLSLKRKDIPLLRRKIGVVFQDFQLLTDRNVEKNLLFVLQATGWKDKNLMISRIKEVLSMVGLENKSNNMPHTLSGGEQQRIAIARALLNKPELIIADEPTGNLDPETSEEIMKILIAVAKESNASVIMATHDMSMVEKFPGRIIRVENQLLKEIEHLNKFDPFSSYLDT